MQAFHARRLYSDLRSLVAERDRVTDRLAEVELINAGSRAFSAATRQISRGFEERIQSAKLELDSRIAALWARLLEEPSQLPTSDAEDWLRSVSSSHQLSLALQPRPRPRKTESPREQPEEAGRPGLVALDYQRKLAELRAALVSTYREMSGNVSDALAALKNSNTLLTPAGCSFSSRGHTRHTGCSDTDSSRLTYRVLRTSTTSPTPLPKPGRWRKVPEECHPGLEARKMTCRVFRMCRTPLPTPLPEPERWRTEPKASIRSLGGKGRGSGVVVWFEAGRTERRWRSRAGSTVWSLRGTSSGRSGVEPRTGSSLSRALSDLLTSDPSSSSSPTLIRFRLLSCCALLLIRKRTLKRERKVEDWGKEMLRGTRIKASGGTPGECKREYDRARLSARPRRSDQEVSEVNQTHFGSITWNFAKLVILMFQDRDWYSSTRLDEPYWVSYSQNKFLKY